MKKIERAVLVQVLNEYGTQVEVGKKLGVSRQYIAQMIREYGIKAKKQSKMVKVDYAHLVKKTVTVYR